MILKRMAVLAGALLICAGVLPAQITCIEGKVTGEDGQPLKDAVIKIERTDVIGHYQVKTDKKGHYFYGGLAIGSYNVCVEVDGKQRDCANKVQTSTQNYQEISFDLHAQKERAEAATTGVGLTKDQERQMTSEERSQMKKAQADRAQALEHKQKLNESFASGMQALNCANKTGPCVPPAADPNNPQAAPPPMTPETYFAQAAASFKHAAELDPKQDVVWSHLAEAQVGLAKTQTGADQQASLADAKDSFEKAIALKPADPAIHNNYALALAQMKKFPEATAELQKAAELDPPGAGKYYYNLGALLVNAGQYDEAAGMFKKAIELTPTYAEAHFQYAMCLSSKMTVTPDGKTVAPPEMKDELDKYLELAPNGGNADAAKAMLQTIGAEVQTKYVNPNAAKKPKK